MQSDKNNKMTNVGFPNGYALIIGIGDDLPDTVNDAKILHKILIDTQKAGYPTDQVQLITEGGATKQGIINALEKLANQTKGKNDATVLIYYSGHGGRIMHNDEERYILVPHDYSESDTETGLFKEDFAQLVNQIDSQKIMLIFDCCHADGVKAIGHKPKQDFQPLVDGLGAGGGRVVMASCKADEKSYIDKEKNHGVFTLALIEALEGKNTMDNKKYISFNDICQYLIEQVPIRAYAIKKKPQTPVFNLTDFTGFDVCFYNSDVYSDNSNVPLKPSVFVISDPKDTVYLRKMKDHLNILVNQGFIELSDIEDIPPFAIIEKALEQKLEQAAFVLGLMSINFLNSQLCLNLHQKAVLQNKPFTPILLKPCGMKYLDEFKGYINPIPRKNGISLPLDNWGLEEAEAYMQITDALFEMTQPKK